LRLDGTVEVELSQTASARLRLHLHAASIATRVEFVTWITITNAWTWVPSAERPDAEASADFFWFFSPFFKKKKSQIHL